ncbi:MAG: hypothetical protein Q8O67_02915 [Deltaproteobacteria bacterium]|nr:hypothetical protein [Deltaproteobacteria bacterium]
MSKDERPFMERLGVRTLERRSLEIPKANSVGDGVVHLVDAEERAALQRIERQALARAALAGAGSALISAIAEVCVQDHETTDPILYWGVIAAAGGVAAIAEIAFLSFDALRTVHRMSVAAGVLAVDDDAHRSRVLTSLARAALEVPNPPTSAFGVNPHREANKLLLIGAAVIYKLKVSVTNVVIKQVVRRALGRAAVRSFLPFLAIPGTALWDFLVCRVVLREARVRIFGPSLANDVVERLLPPGHPVSPLLAEALMRAAASCVVRTADLHPNLELLLAALVARLQAPVPDAVDDTAAFLRLLPSLDEADGGVVRRFLRAGAVIDGRVARRERALLREASAWIADDVEGERRRVLAGEPLLLA